MILTKFSLSELRKAFNHVIIISHLFVFLSLHFFRFLWAGETKRLDSLLLADLLLDSQLDWRFLFSFSECLFSFLDRDDD